MVSKRNLLRRKVSKRSCLERGQTPKIPPKLCNTTYPARPSILFHSTSQRRLWHICLTALSARISLASHQRPRPPSRCRPVRLCTRVLGSLNDKAALIPCFPMTGSKRLSSNTDSKHKKFTSSLLLRQFFSHCSYSLSSLSQSQSFVELFLFSSSYTGAMGEV